MSFLSRLEMGLGTWSWGKGQVWGYGKDYNENDLRNSFKAALSSGIRLFDTAEVYGNGDSERFLGQFLQEKFQEKIYIATKFAPLPYRIRVSSLLKALRASLQRLQLPTIDLYQLHWISPPRSIKAWMEPLAQAVKEGLAKEVGVSNFDRDQMLRARDALSAWNIPLSSNQSQYSLVRRANEFSGLLEACKMNDIRFIAYSPLGMGMLSGKYSPQNPPSGLRRLFYWGQLADIQTLVQTLRQLGQAHVNKTVNQVALNWLLCKGALPIPGAKTAAQAHENSGAMGWRLDPSEVDQLDKASRRFTR